MSNFDVVGDRVAVEICHRRFSSLLSSWYLHFETTKKIDQVKERLKAARDRQKSYAESQRNPLEFSVDDRVLLKVSSRKGVVRFSKRSKLSSRYVGPYEILERVSPVAYRMRLPQELVGVHDTFHVSNLKKCLADVNLHVPLEEVKIDNKLHFVKKPMEIMDREVKKLKKRWILIVKVCWNSRQGPEVTWEQEDEKKRKYPQPFARYDLGRATKISGRNSLSQEKIVTSVNFEVKENQEKEKIESKPNKNGKRGEAGKSQKQLQ
nr:putative reverse transcriptase domain-containing protein [Tanacetum cinerariifolium]